MKITLAVQREELRLRREEEAKAETNGGMMKEPPPMYTPNRVITRSSMQSEVPLLTLTPAKRNGSLGMIHENGKLKPGENCVPQNDGQTKLNGMVQKQSQLPISILNKSDDPNEVFVQNEMKSNTGNLQNGIVHESGVHALDNSLTRNKRLVSFWCS